MYRIVLIIITLCINTFSITAQNQPSNDYKSINTNLDSLFQYCYENSLFNGSVFIFKEDQTLFKKTYGKLGFESDELISSDTPFLLASISKQFTAFGIVMLHSKGVLEYEDYVNKYLPEFPYPKITIRHLLNHTSGLPDYEEFINPQVERLNERHVSEGFILTNEKVAAMFAKNRPPLGFSPGSQFGYSNTGYLYLATLIESLSGVNYSTYLNEAIFKPLQMHNTWVYDSNESLRDTRAIGYTKSHIINEYTVNEAPPFLKVYGDGGLYSSAIDLQKWYLALDSHSLVGEDELNEAYERPMIDGEKGPYGFGWFIRELPFNGHKALTHSGQFMGFTNSIFRDLDDQITSAILSNNSHDINGEINSAVVRIIYGMPYDLPKLNAEMTLGKMIYESGVAQAIEFYNIKKDDELYNFSEKSINSLGYKFFKLDNINKAIEVFKWNVELNPESSNVYDSLGEAYLQLHNKKAALENYQKAFELDNTNSNAAAIIKKIKSE